MLVPNGLNDRILEKGLREWRKRHPVQVDDGDAMGADSAETLNLI